MAKEFKVPKRRQPIFSIVKKIFALTTWRGIKVVSLAGEIPNKCILLGNHSAKVGPMAYEIALPVFNNKWGAYEMLGNYKSRRRYLIDVFYMKKQGWSKRKASFKSTFEAIFSKMIYKGMKIMGTYPDMRLRITIKNSIKVLEADQAILIFPENSNDGYYDIMTSFFPGFVMLSEQYYKLHNEDLPIYPVYYGFKQKKIVIGNPIYLQDLKKQGLDKTAICEVYCNAVNDLYYKYFQDENINN